MELRADPRRSRDSGATAVRTARPDEECRSSGTAADPALLLEARLQLRADLLGNLLDAALDRVAAAELAVRLHARRQDEARRVVSDRPGCDAYRHPRRLVAGRGHIAGAELAQTHGRHLIAFDRDFQLGLSGRETDAHALGGTALLHGQERAFNDQVIDLRPGGCRADRRGHAHADDL